MRALYFVKLHSALYVPLILVVSSWYGPNHEVFMDFTTFVPIDMIQPLKWLGHREWIEYGDIPERRCVWARPKRLEILKGEKPDPLERIINDGLTGRSITEVAVEPWLRSPGVMQVSQGEFRNRPRDHWIGVQSVLECLRNNVVMSYWYFALSKTLAEGPKLFKASPTQCLDLEDMDVPVPFDEYHTPYSTFIIEVPAGYRQRLATMHGLTKGPSHVFVHHEPGKIITVSAFFDHGNVITHISMNRPEYKTLEDTITRNRKRRMAHTTGDGESIALGGIDHPEEFDAAEVVQRMALNFGLYMTLIKTRQVGSLDPRLDHWKNQAKRSNPNAVDKAKKHLAAQIDQIVFDQVVHFSDDPPEYAPSLECDGSGRRSPRPHRRRGHWRKQWVGPITATPRAYKYLPIKPCFIRKAAFIAAGHDPSQLKTTYVPKPRKVTPPEDST